VEHESVFVPFIVELQRVLPVQRGHELPDHRLGLIPLVPPQHPDVGHQPGHRADCHTAHFPLDVVSDLLHAGRDDGEKKEEGWMWSEECGVRGRRMIMTKTTSVHIA